MSAPRPEELTRDLAATPFGRALAGSLLEMQEAICGAFAALDDRPFARDLWRRAEGGGGVARVLEGGALLEKAGVMYSAINGRTMPRVVLEEYPELEGRPYFATGVSLIFHPRNPHVPTVHFNVRYFEADPVYWFGGGMDLTPYYPVRADCIHFHRTVKACCDRFDPTYYPRFKQACDEYFHLRHRREPRGIGGIFFNYLRDAREPTRDFILALGDTFVEAYRPIAERRRDTPWGERERAFQAYRRGRYVEFNLLYDQGTLFGLQSAGRVESILVSMPPVVQWRYDWRPEPGSPEARLTEEFLPPRDWAALAE